MKKGGNSGNYGNMDSYLMLYELHVGGHEMILRCYHIISGTCSRQ